MNFIPLRTAVIAGTCAVALSFVAVPAFADEMPPTGDSSMVTTTPDDGSGATTTPDDGSDATTTPDDGSGDGSTTTTTNDGTTDDTDNMGDSTGDDATDPTPSPDPTDTVAPLPAEPGTPEHRIKDGELSPRDVVHHGIRVEYSGLTPHAAYQPFYTTGQSGGPVGHAKKADGKGRLTVVWHPASSTKSPFAHAGAHYSLGLMGTVTQLTLLDDVSVGYDSDLVWSPAKRHGGTVTLEVRADHAKSVGTKDVAWKKVEVEFQKKVDHRWVTVTTKHTNADGVAKATFVAGKNVWRAVIAAKGSVFGSMTKGHRK